MVSISACTLSGIKMVDCRGLDCIRRGGNLVNRLVIRVPDRICRIKRGGVGHV